MIDIVGNVRAALPLPASAYAASAGRLERTPTLRGGERADVAIVGGGITGLSTAIALAERSVSVALLEANEPGWGASGRNGGHINPGLKHNPDEIEDTFGPDLGRRMIAFSYGAPDAVFDLVRKYSIACDIVRTGGYRASVGAVHAGMADRLYEQFARRGMPVELHGKEKVAAAIGTTRYENALFDRRAGHLDPLKYTRGLARVAAELGARLFVNASATAVTKQATGWRVATATGHVDAGRVLFATNGYSGPLLPGLRRSILPVYSSIVASSPLPDPVARSILPGREVVYESGRLTTYYRVDAANRLIFGGRGVMRPVEGAAKFPWLVAYAIKLWPSLKSVAWEYGWNGRLAVTADGYPHLHDMGDGRLACLGYNGRGVAVGTAIGAQLAARLIKPDAQLDLAITPIKRIAFQPFWRIGAIPAVAWNSFRDRIGQ